MALFWRNNIFSKPCRLLPSDQFSGLYTQKIIWEAYACKPNTNVSYNCNQYL